MDLPFWPRGTLWEALASFRAMKAPNLAADTFRDYSEKEHWLLEVFGLRRAREERIPIPEMISDRERKAWARNLGESYPIDRINFLALEDLWREEQRDPCGLAGVTVLKRFYHVGAALRYASRRGILPKADLPELPEIENDGRPGQRVVEVKEHTQLRLALSERKRAFADLAFWTGQHRAELFSMLRWMLDPDYEWRDDDGTIVYRGAFWRRNGKTNALPDGWVPMEPEFIPIARELVAALPSGDSLITGPISDIAKAFRTACDRCEIPRINPQRDMRRSYASLLRARGYGDEYVRICLAHAGNPVYSAGGTFAGTQRPTVATKHYLRATEALFVNELRARAKRMG